MAGTDIYITVKAEEGAPTIPKVIEKQLKGVNKKLKEVSKGIDTATLDKVAKRIEKIANRYEVIRKQIIKVNRTIGNTSASMTRFMNKFIARLHEIELAYREIAIASESMALTVKTSVQDIISTMQQAAEAGKAFQAEIQAISGATIIIDIHGRGSSERPITEKFDEIIAGFENAIAKMQAVAKAAPISIKFDRQDFDKLLELVRPTDIQIFRNILPIIDKLRAGFKVTKQEIDGLVVGLREVGILATSFKFEELKVLDIADAVRAKKHFDELGNDVYKYRGRLLELLATYRSLNDVQRESTAGKEIREEIDLLERLLTVYQQNIVQVEVYNNLLRRTPTLKPIALAAEKVDPISDVLKRIGDESSRLNNNLKKVELQWIYTTDAGYQFAAATQNSLKIAAAASEKYRDKVVKLAETTHLLAEAERQVLQAYSAGAYKGRERQFISDLVQLEKYNIELDKTYRNVLDLRAVMAQGIIDEAAATKAAANIENIDKEARDLTISFKETVLTVSALIEELSRARKTGAVLGKQKATGGFLGWSPEAQAAKLNELKARMTEITAEMRKYGTDTTAVGTKASEAFRKIDQAIRQLGVDTKKTTDQLGLLVEETMAATRIKVQAIRPIVDPKNFQALGKVIKGVGLPMSELEKKSALAAQRVKVLETELNNVSASAGAFSSGMSQASRSASILKSIVTALGKEYSMLVDTQAAIRTSMAAIELQTKKNSAATNRSYASLLGQNKAYQELKAAQKEVSAAMSRVTVQQAKYEKRLQESNLLMARSADASKAMARWTVDGFTQMIKSQSAWLIGFAIFFGAFDRLKSAIDSLIDSQDQLARAMRTVRSEIMSTAKVAKIMREEMYDAAVTMGAAFEETGELFYQLGSAGLAAEESLSAFESTLKAIIATEEEVADFTKLVAGIYKNFRKELAFVGNQTAQFTHINDVLVATFRDHIVEMSELRDGMKYSIATAHEVGVSFDMLAAILGVLNDNMIKAGIAGRSLQVIFARMAKDADKFSEAFDIEIDMNKPLDFMDVMEKVADKLNAGALTAEEVGTVFERLGLRGAKSFITLAKNIDDVNMAIAEIGSNSAGATEEMYNAMKDRPERILKEISAALDAVLRINVKPFVDAFLSVSKIIVDAIDAVETLDEKLGGMLGGIASVAAAFAAWKVSLLAVSSATSVLLKGVLKYQHINFAQYINMETQALSRFAKNSAVGAKAMFSLSQETKRTARETIGLRNAFADINKAILKESVAQFKGSTISASLFENQMIKTQASVYKYGSALGALNVAQKGIEAELKRGSITAAKFADAIRGNIDAATAYKRALIGAKDAQRKAHENLVIASRSAVGLSENLRVLTAAWQLAKSGAIGFSAALGITLQMLAKFASRLLNIYLTVTLVLEILKPLYNLFVTTSEEISEAIDKTNQSIAEQQKLVSKYSDAINAIEDYEDGYISLDKAAVKVVTAFKDIKGNIPDFDIGNIDEIKSKLISLKDEAEKIAKAYKEIAEFQAQALRAKNVEEVEKAMTNYTIAIEQTTYFGWLGAASMKEHAFRAKVFRNELKASAFAAGVYATELGVLNNKVERLSEGFEAGMVSAERLSKTKDTLQKKFKQFLAASEPLIDVIKKLDGDYSDLDDKTKNYIQTLLELRKETEKTLGIYGNYEEAARQMIDVIEGLVGSTEDLGNIFAQVADARNADQQISVIQNFFRAMSDEVDKHVKSLEVLPEGYDEVTYRTKLLADAFAEFGVVVDRDAASIDIMLEVLAKGIQNIGKITKEELLEFPDIFESNFLLASEIVRKYSLEIGRDIISVFEAGSPAQKALFEFVEHLQTQMENASNAIDQYFDDREIVLDLKLEIAKFEALLSLGDKFKKSFDAERQLKNARKLLKEIHDVASDIEGIALSDKFERMGLAIEKANKYFDVFDKVVGNVSNSITDASMKSQLFGNVTREGVSNAISAYRLLNEMLDDAVERMKKYAEAQLEAASTLRKMNAELDILKLLSQVGISVSGIISAEKKLNELVQDRKKAQEKINDLNEKSAEIRTKLRQISISQATLDNEQQKQRAKQYDDLFSQLKNINSQLSKQRDIIKKANDQEVSFNEELKFQEQIIRLLNNALVRTNDQIGMTTRELEREEQAFRDISTAASEISNKIGDITGNIGNQLGQQQKLLSNYDRQRDSIDRQIELIEEQNAYYTKRIDLIKKLIDLGVSDENLQDKLAAFLEKQERNHQKIFDLRKKQLGIANQQREIAKEMYDAIKKQGDAFSARAKVQAMAYANELLSSEEALNQMVVLLEQGVIPALTTMVLLIGKVAESFGAITADEMISILKQTKAIGKDLVDDNKENNKILDMTEEVIKRLGSKWSDVTRAANEAANEFREGSEITERARENVRESANNMDELAEATRSANGPLEQARDLTQQIADNLLTAANEMAGIGGGADNFANGGNGRGMQHGGAVSVRVSDGEAYIPKGMYDQNRRIFDLMNSGARLIRGQKGIDQIQTFLPVGSYIVSRKGVNANREFFETSMPARLYSGGQVGASGTEDPNIVSTTQGAEDMGSITLTLNVEGKPYTGDFVARKDVAKELKHELKREIARKIQ